MGLGRRAVDDLHVSPVRCHQGFEQALPKTAPGPSIEAIVDRCRRPIDRWAILPAAAHPQHVNDAADHPSVIDPTRTRLIARQQRFDHRPLPIAQPELARHLQSSVVSKLESLLANEFNPLIEF
jgi:hypothetical protein